MQIIYQQRLLLQLISLIAVFAFFGACTDMRIVENDPIVENPDLNIGDDDDDDDDIEPPPPPPIFEFQTFQEASTVIGQDSFTENDNSGCTPWNSPNTQRNRVCPHGSPFITDDGKLLVSDNNNHRVLVWNDIANLESGADADFVIGQADFISHVTSSNVSDIDANVLMYPRSMHVYGEKLLLIDPGIPNNVHDRHNRILIWDTFPETSLEPADHVVGQSRMAGFSYTGNPFSDIIPWQGCEADELNDPEDLWVDPLGRLYVADTDNHRVLIWNQIPQANGVPANVVLGQVNFDTCNFNHDFWTLDASSMHTPTGVWSDGTMLMVADSNNFRILIWDTIPTVPGTPADRVLIQDDFISKDTLHGNLLSWNVTDVVGNATQLFATQAFAHRVLGWSSQPAGSGGLPDLVFGQSDVDNTPDDGIDDTFRHYTENDDNQDDIADGAPTARTVKGPGGLALNASGNVLALSDHNNSRVLLYRKVEVPQE